MLVEDVKEPTSLFEKSRGFSQLLLLALMYHLTVILRAIC